MSSTTLTRFQTPAHTYGHPETEPQQPYSNYQFSSYSADSRSLANDANSYAQTEDLYDPGCSYVSYGPEYSSSQFEESDGAFGHGHMQNNAYPSPQLLCPRPTLPPSQFSPHFSWYDWPNEAPANVYQAERNTSLIAPHPSQAGEIHHSLGNQQFMSKFYPGQTEFAESVPNALSSSYRWDGYTQPFVEPIPPFDQCPTQSTHFNVQTGFYYTAHQPVPPEQRSSYSELAPNLNFMNSQSQPPLVHKEPSHPQNLSIPKPKKDGAITKGTISSPDLKKNPFALGFDGPPLTAFGRKVPSHAPLPVSFPVPLNPSKTSDYIGYDSTISSRQHMEMFKGREPLKLG